MLASFLSQALLLLAAGTATLAKPVWPHYSVDQEHFEVLRMRASEPLNEAAVYDVQCLDSSKRIVFHDENVAQLSICGSIAGSSTGCDGAPAETTGRSGSAKFELKPRSEGGSITISKRKWGQCVRAARAICPTGSFTGMCRGGASNGDVSFSLDRA